MFEKNCRYCSQIIRVKDKRRKFCDSSCAAKYNNIGLNRWGQKSKYYELPLPKCLNCRDTVKRHDRKYCSMKCANQHIALERYGSYTATTAKIECEVCNGDFVPSHSDITVCSKKCSNIRIKQNKIKLWQKDPHSATVLGHGLSRVIRLYLIEQADNQCSKCQWGKVNPTTGKVPLEINHIDGDSTNNNSDNLEVLCPNCHSLTPTYKALNKGRSTRLRK